MFGGPERTPPRPIDLLTRRFDVHCAAPRPLLRVTPDVRSLNTESPFESRPVVMLYGSADAPWTFRPIRTPRPIGVLKLTKRRWRTSLAAGPQSKSGFVLSDGNIDGESAKLRALAS